MRNLDASTAYVGSTEISEVRLGEQLVLAPNGNELWYTANEVPSLDLRFAEDKSLVDATTGSNLVDFTRASSGTYVGSDGLIKTATTNLLLQSEDFSTTWTSFNLTTTVNQIAAPTGTTTADLTTGNAGTNIKRLRQNVSTTALGPWTFSVWLKTNTAASALIVLFDSSVGGANNVRTTLTFSTGAVSSGVAAGTATGASASVQNFGNGWYRVSITGTFVTALTSVWAEIWLDGYQYTANETSFYLWGAQLEQSDTVGEYVKTTSTINSAPRFDHDPTTGESLGLLVEESRTNQFQASSFAGAGWIEDNLSVVSSNNPAPDGSNTAVIVGNATSATTNSFLSYSKDVTGALHTFSFYAKATTAGQSAFIDYYDAGVNRSRGFIDLDNGAVSYHSQAGDGVISAVNAGNGWWRCQLTVTPAGSTLYEWRAGNAASGNVYLWGAQLEEGSFPTSYIPTEGSTVTRAADVASISGSNFSGWFNASEGSIFSDSRIIKSSTQTQVVYHFDGANYDISLRQPHLTADQFRANIGNVFTASPGTGGALSAGTTKAVVAYLGTAGRLQVGPASDNATMAGTLDASQLFIGNLNGATQLNGTLKRLTYWPTRLGNDTLQTITQ